MVQMVGVDMANRPRVTSKEAEKHDMSASQVADGLRLFHDSRPERAQRVDEQSDAPLTADIDRWGENPDRLDFPGVDTGPTFREENPSFDLDRFLDTFY